MTKQKRAIPLSVAIPGLGDRIRLAREFLRMSKAEMSRELGVTPSAVSQWESGDAEPSVAHMLKLKRTHQIPLDFIYAEDLEAPKPGLVRFIADYGARPDAPELARRVRQQWGMPVPMIQHSVAADDVAAAILQAHPTTRPRGRPRRQQLHEDTAPPED